MNLVAGFVRNPVKIAVGVLLFLLFGSLSAHFMPKQLVPEVQRQVISITTRWPGASPQEVEREIIEEQEEQLKGVEGVTKMSSESTDSQGTVNMEFAVGTDISSALLKVNTRLQQVREYPEDAQEPVIATSASSDRPIAWIILRRRVPSAERVAAVQAEHPELREILEPARRAGSGGLRGRRIETAVEQHPDNEVLQGLLPPRVDVPKKLRLARDMVEARLERVKGVSNSNVYGGEEEELQVVVDPQRLAARAITIPQLRLAMGVRNRDISAGEYWEGKRRYVVRTLGQFRKPSDVETVVVSRRDGVPVYVSDVAEVRIGYKKPQGAVFNFGERVLAVNVIRETGANVLDVMEGVKDAIEELNAGVLKDNGLELEQAYDETDYINSAIGLLQQNFLLGGILTTLVLLIFLRSLRSTLVIALAIPSSVAGTFLFLGLFGRSLNVVSLAGMAFAVGMLVDNAIVVLENIYRRYQGGERRVEAAVKGTQEVWGAVIASTLTTLAVFIPILFLRDEVGQLFGDIAIAISCAVGLSLIVSVTVIPTATARILPRRNRAAEAKGPERDVLDPNAFVPRWFRPLVYPFDLLGGSFRGLVTRTHAFLERGVIRQIVFSAVLIGISIVAAIEMFPKQEYLPSGNQNMAIALIFPPPGYNLDEMTRIGQVIDERLRPYWDVDPDDPKTAELPFPAISEHFFVAAGRQLFLGARAQDDARAGQLVGLLQQVTQGIPGTFTYAAQTSLFEQGVTASRSIDVEIRGPDLHRLVQLGGRVMGQAMGLFPRAQGGQVRPVPSLDLSSPEVHVLPRWERAADTGLTGLDLGYTVNALVDGAYAGDFFTGGDKIDLTIVGKERYADHLQDLPDLPVATPTGNLVPLGAVARIELSSGPEQINRRERERAITIQIGPPEKMALEEAVDIVEKRIVQPMQKDGSLGGDYRITLGGTADKLVATQGRLLANLLLAVAITYLLMAGLFESWLYPLVVIVSVPLGAVGGILGLNLLNVYLQSGIVLFGQTIVEPIGAYQQLDVLTMIGFIILIGTVVNNAILIVHQALNNMRAENLGPRDAVRESVRSRLRPIFMTLFTTLFGLAPLVFLPGAGSELYRGIGSILVGGLFVSTIFTLFLVPTLFRLLLGLKLGVAAKLHGERTIAEIV